MVELFPMSPEDVEVEVELAEEEELMLMETEGVLVLAVVTRLEVVEVVEEKRPELGMSAVRVS